MPLRLFTIKKGLKSIYDVSFLKTIFRYIENLCIATTLYSVTVPKQHQAQYYSGLFVVLRIFLNVLRI